MTYDFTLITELPASPNQIYKSWLSSEGHTAMTGGVAHITDREGEVYDAWDGYITGRNIELIPHHRIVESWRTKHFLPNHSDSIIEITLQEIEDGTRLELKHRNVPEDQTSYEESGWINHYFIPMRKRFEWLQMNLADSE